MAEPQASWTILATLRWTTDYFRTKGVPEPRAAAEVLLAHTLSVSRLDLYLRYDQPLNPEELARFKALMLRRREGEPVAYLTGHREFWSLDFQVTPAVLIPRPETEALVAAALEAAESVGAGLKPAPTIEEKVSLSDIGQKEDPPKTENRKPKTSPLWGLEVGVGSGAVIIALAKELPSMAWVGLDTSGAALAVARGNARQHGVADRVHLLKSDLLAALKPSAAFALLVANLPYVPRAQWEQLPREIKAFEPPGALLGGEDGLDLIRPLVRQAHRYVKAGGWVLLEVGDRQAPQVTALVEETGAFDRIEAIKDFSGVERVVRARRRETAG
jgi:release factor glutamine methyltransferase